MKVRLISYTKDLMDTVEEAAALCYGSSPTPNGRITKNCYSSGHTSVLEHMNFTFAIEGISRACSHQLVRHRIASYSQRSQRYFKEGDFPYVIPETISDSTDTLSHYQDVMREIENCYSTLLDAGIPAEDARMVLPNACHTAITVTMNLRTLVNFCNERMCVRAQWEIRELANAMKEIIHMGIEIPFYQGETRITQYLVPKCEKLVDYPICPELKGCGKYPKMKEIHNVKEKNI